MKNPSMLFLRRLAWIAMVLSLLCVAGCIFSWTSENFPVIIIMLAVAIATFAISLLLVLSLAS